MTTWRCKAKVAMKLEGQTDIKKGSRLFTIAGEDFRRGKRRDLTAFERGMIFGAWSNKNNGGFPFKYFISPFPRCGGGGESSLVSFDVPLAVE